MIIKRLDQFYSDVLVNNNTEKLILLKRIAGVVFRVFVNIYIPIYYKYICNISKIDRKSKIKHNDVIVSLTSFKARINKIHLCIESILRQSVVPSKIILYISKDEFSDALELPRNLLRLTNYGLSIEFVDGNIRSHKKYMYSFKQYKDKTIVLFDDDIFYPEHILLSLIEHSKKYPNSVCASRARIIKYNSDNEIDYLSWPLINNESPPGPALFATSGGGTLYPAFSRSENLLDVNLAFNLSPSADDIWLHAITRAAGSYVTKTNYSSALLQIIFLNNISLHSLNVAKGQNNVQLYNVDRYFKSKFGYSPFLDN